MFNRKGINILLSGFYNNFFEGFRSTVHASYRAKLFSVYNAKFPIKRNC